MEGNSVEVASSISSTVIRGVSFPLKTPDAPTWRENFTAVACGISAIITKSISPNDQ